LRHKSQEFRSECWGGFDPWRDGFESFGGDEFINSRSSRVICRANRESGVMVTLFDDRDYVIQTADIAIHRYRRIL
jgi:hypothetical protein